MEKTVTILVSILVALLLAAVAVRLKEWWQWRGVKKAQRERVSKLFPQKSKI